MPRAMSSANSMRLVTSRVRPGRTDKTRHSTAIYCRLDRRLCVAASSTAHTMELTQLLLRGHRRSSKCCTTCPIVVPAYSNTGEVLCSLRT
jgi:hypothetical protein